MTDFAVVIIIIMGLNGSMEHKSILKEACPRESIAQMELLLEKKKGKGSIRDYGIVCFPGQFENSTKEGM